MSNGKLKFSGLVVKGIKKGSEIGIPTMNVELFKHNNDIDFGIYSCLILIDGEVYKAVAHYGNKSIGTDDKRKIFCEIHVFEFDKDVYGHEVSFNLLKKIRDVREFKSDVDLLRQIKKDIVQVNKFFKKNAE